MLGPAPKEPVEFAQISDPQDSFAEVCKKFNIAADDDDEGRRFAINGTTYFLQLSADENVLGVFWDEEIAMEHGIRSTRGLLMTTYGRIFGVMNGGDLTYCTGAIYSRVTETTLSRDQLLRVAKMLPKLCYRYSEESARENIWRAMQELERAGPPGPLPAEELGFAKTVSAETSFRDACAKLGLMTDADGLMLVRADGQHNCAMDLGIARDEREKPLLRIVKGSKSLVVTSFGRMIWCDSRGTDSRCLDLPFGRPLNVFPSALYYWSQQFLMSAAGWSGIKEFYEAIKRETMPRT